MKKKKIILYTLLSILCMSIVAISSIAIFLFIIPLPVDLTKLQSNKTKITLYDLNDEIIDNYSSYATFDEIPKNLINAFIAVEDKRFYNHKGYDVIRIAGSLKNNILNKTNQGASTITQQLARNKYLTLDQTLDRKIKEIRISNYIEKNLTKNEILECYLNMLYFGSGEYGIKNAAKRFFGKELNELTIKECALLAGIIKSPTKYNPLNNIENSINRSITILGLMKNENYITNAEYEKAKNEPVIIKNTLIHNNNTLFYSNNVYFEAAQLLNLNPEDIPYLDINIYTYMDKTAQNNMHSIVFDNSYNQDIIPSSLGLNIDNKTYGIKALDSNFDINIYSFKRSPGSTIKPFAVYAPALDSRNYHLFSKIPNIKTDFNGYSPSNYNDYYSEYENIFDSISNSYNIPAVNTLKSIGIDTSISYLSKIDINLPKEDHNLALALGGLTYGLNMLDIAKQFSTIANLGLYSNPTFIRKITLKNGNILYKHDKNTKQVMSKETARLLTYAMQDSTKNGTASKLKNINFDIASKTGTVSCLNKDFNSDIYNISYTPNDTILMWQGSVNSSNFLPKNYTGGASTTLMVKDYTPLLYKNTSPTAFEILESVDFIDIDKNLYENQNIVKKCDKNCPNYNKKSVLINKKYDNIEQDNCYSNIDCIRFCDLCENNNNYICWKLDNRFAYKIYISDGFNQTLIDNIKDMNGDYKLKILDENYKYIIIPYYIDDNKNEIIGLPYKYSTNFNTLVLDQ